jgi:acyl-CoA thioester hydrolase
MPECFDIMTDRGTEAMSEPFSINIRVYYEDTDAGGIVYNANYIKYIERARTEWLRSFGVEQDILLERNVAFVVKHIDIDFRRPAKFNELLKVTCEPTKFAGASIVFTQHVYNQNGDELIEAKVKLACIDLKEFSPMLIPDYAKEVIKSGS